MVEVKRKAPWDDPSEGGPDTGGTEQQPATIPALPSPVSASTPAVEPNPVEMRRIKFDVTQEFHRQLRMKVATDDVTIADIGRRLLEMWLSGEVVVDGLR